MGFAVAVLLYNLRSDDLLHNENTCCDDSKIVEDLGSFFVDPWTLQFDVCARFTVVCLCICPVCVLLFYTWNNKEFWDNFSSSDPAGCSRNKGIHLAASAVVYCTSPDYQLSIWVHAVVLHLKWEAE